MKPIARSADRDSVGLEAMRTEQSLLIELLFGNRGEELYCWLCSPSAGGACRETRFTRSVQWDCGYRSMVVGLCSPHALGPSRVGHRHIMFTQDKATVQPATCSIANLLYSGCLAYSTSRSNMSGCQRTGGSAGYIRVPVRSGSCPTLDSDLNWH